MFQEVDPPDRVVYTTRYEYPDGRPSFQTHVTVTFEPRGVRTLLTVLDTGYPTRGTCRERERVAGLPGWVPADTRILTTRGTAQARTPMNPRPGHDVVRHRGGGWVRNVSPSDLNAAAVG
jgi:uncharacterized protein YndB with AHSA1/START domain